MATPPVIQCLRLDDNHDLIWDTSATLTDANAVAQIIETRLLLFLGEWWENTAIGLPVFQLILGQLGSNQGIAAMTLAVQQNIEGAPFVTAVSAVSVVFADGRLSITASAQTTFGTVNISTTTAPAVTAAGLGGA